MISPDSSGWYSLEGDLSPELIRQFSEIALLEKLSITKLSLMTVKLAQRLSCLRVRRLWLWCNITRRAMRHVIRMPGLHTIDVLCISGPSCLANFRDAQDLEIFRANYGMTDSDLLEVTQCPQLRELAVQNAELSHASISAILSLPGLTSLDLEATRFDDHMAKQTSRSKTIKSLEIGATRITRIGLEHLVRMEQLQSLDLWATDLNERDLRLIVNLPNLEYVSLGNHDEISPLNSRDITELLLGCPQLKRVWLDGVNLEPTQKNDLEAKLDSLRITLPSDDA